MAISALLVCVAAAQQSQANRMKQSADETFATKAAQGGIAEVEFGNLASQRASNEKVKQFGQQMVTDHTKANDELKAIATRKGLTLPTSMDSKSEATRKHLSTLSGAAFDRAYMQDMVSDHRKDIAEFQQEASHGTDSDLKEFASKTLPTLQHHLELAEQALAAAKGAVSH